MNKEFEGKNVLITETIRSIILDFGKIDVLVQAAGLLRGKPALKITENEWDQMLNVNAKGTFFIMQETVRRSMQFHGGSIINLASMAGIRGMRKGMEAAHYSASKGAVTALTMQAATEWADKGVRVNCIAPGGIKTKAMEELKFEGALNPVPLGRLSDPEDIAHAVLFLSGEKSAMITGQTLIIGGIFGNEMPEGFCAMAWQALVMPVNVLVGGGKVLGLDERHIACCTDGVRPAIFLLERVEDREEGK